MAIELTSEEKKELIEEKIKAMEKLYGKAAKILTLEIINLTNDLNEKTQTRYIALPDWNLYHRKPTVSAIRNYITQRKTNGFDDVLRKDGKLWYIDEAKFFEWKENRLKRKVG